MEIVRVEKVSEKTTEIELKSNESILRIDVKSDNSLHIYSPGQITFDQIKSVHDLTIRLD